MGSRPLAASIVLAGLLCATSARAQRPSAPDLWQPFTLGPWVAYTAYVPDAGELMLRPVGFFRSIRGQYSADGKLVRTSRGVSELAAELDLGLQLGLASRLAVGVQPTLLYERSRTNGRSDHRVGLGQTPLSGQLVLVRERAFPVPQLTLFAVVKAPTATLVHQSAAPDQPPTGPDTWDTGLGLSLSKSLRPVVVHLEALASRPVTTELSGAPFKEGLYVLWSSSVEVVSANQRLVLALELSGLHQARTRLNRVAIPKSGSHELNFGAMLQAAVAPTLRFGLGLQRTLWGLNSTATTSFGAVLGWVP